MYILYISWIRISFLNRNYSINFLHFIIIILCKILWNHLMHFINCLCTIYHQILITYLFHLSISFNEFTFRRHLFLFIFVKTINFFHCHSFGWKSDRVQNFNNIAFQTDIIRIQKLKTQMIKVKNNWKYILCWIRRGGGEHASESNRIRIWNWDELFLAAHYNLQVLLVHLQHERFREIQD